MVIKMFLIILGTRQNIRFRHKAILLDIKEFIVLKEKYDCWPKIF
jgi:hypothetical protein